LERNPTLANIEKLYEKIEDFVGKGRQFTIQKRGGMGFNE